jgi:hypothetical protein
VSLALSVRIAAALLIAGCSLLAQDHPGSAKLSITVSNRSDKELPLTLYEEPEIPPPPPPTASYVSPAPRQPPFPAEGEAKPPQPVHMKASIRPPITRLIQPNQSITLEIPPAQYHLATMGVLSTNLAGGGYSAFGGYISITNAELWIFTWEPKGQQVADWKLEVPARPGLRLSGLPERAPVPLRQLRPPPDSRASLPHISQPAWPPASPGTNAVR